MLNQYFGNMNKSFIAKKNCQIDARQVQKWLFGKIKYFFFHFVTYLFVSKSFAFTYLNKFTRGVWNFSKGLQKFLSKKQMTLANMKLITTNVCRSEMKCLMMIHYTYSFLLKYINLIFFRQLFALISLKILKQ